MQRWWFLDDKNGTLTSGSVTTQKTKKTNVPVGDGYQHKFRVLVTQSLLRDEIVAITGNCDSLGNWDPQHVVQMKLDDGEYEYFFTTHNIIQLNLKFKLTSIKNKSYRYRYTSLNLKKYLMSTTANICK